MDLSVRLVLAIRDWVARWSGLGTSLLLGAYLVAHQRRALPGPADVAALAVLVASSSRLLVRRLRPTYAEEHRHLELALVTHAVVGVEALVTLVGSDQGRSYQPAVYAVLMLAAVLIRPIVAAGSVAFTILLEAGLLLADGSPPGYARLFAPLVLALLFTSSNFAIFKTEVARVRRFAHARFDAELQKMKDAARSYRVLTGPGGSVGPRPSSKGEDDRAYYGAVEEIRSALQFALDLVRSTLKLRTAVLLWQDAGGQYFRVQELCSSEQGLSTGPFPAHDGIVAAAVSGRKLVTVTGTRAARHVPYYPRSVAVGCVCAVPVVDHGHVRGVLLVDRPEKTAISGHEEGVLLTATRFIQRAIENERVFAQLERAKLEQGKLYRAADRLAAATTEAQVIEVGVNSAREFTAFDFAVVTLFDRNALEHEICAASGEDMQSYVGRRFAHNSGLVSMSIANRHPLPYRGDYDPIRQLVFARGIELPPLSSLLVVPLLVHERALGSLVLGSKRRGAFGGAARTTLEVLASHLAVSLANARMLKRLEELATVDGLTGLLNKRALMDSASQKIRSAQRFGKALSVLICDLDHFKRVNDEHGHDVGDAVIRQFAEILHAARRDIDVVGRFGGEEFVVICEETAETGALQLAERIRAELEARVLSGVAEGLRITCSIGVATFPSAGRDWEALFKSADEALYASKRGGRNRVTLWDERVHAAA